MLLTDVDGVYWNFGEEDEKFIDEDDVETLRADLEVGQIPPGSMGPKVGDIIRFLDGEQERERRGIIASLDEAVDALESGAGTHVVSEQ